MQILTKQVDRSRSVSYGSQGNCDSEAEARAVYLQREGQHVGSPTDFRVGDLVESLIISNRASLSSRFFVCKSEMPISS